MKILKISRDKDFYLGIPLVTKSKTGEETSLNLADFSELPIVTLRSIYGERYLPVVSAHPDTTLKGNVLVAKVRPETDKMLNAMFTIDIDGYLMDLHIISFEADKLQIVRTTQQGNIQGTSYYDTGLLYYEMDDTVVKPCGALDKEYVKVKKDESLKAIDAQLHRNEEKINAEILRAQSVEGAFQTTLDETVAKVEEQLDTVVKLEEVYETISNPTREQIGDNIFLDKAYITVVNSDGEIIISFAKDVVDKLADGEDAKQKYLDLLGTQLLKLGPTGLYTGTVASDQIIVGEKGIIGIDVKSDDKTNPSWQLNSDGTGSLAKGAISWGKDGTMTFAPGAKITWNRLSALETEAKDKAYTWMKFAKDEAGTGLSDNYTSEMKYIFLAYNKSTATESTDPADYPVKMPIFSESDIPEVKDGKTYYTWRKYADAIDSTTKRPKDTDMYDTPKSTTCYLGIAFNKTEPQSSAVEAAYASSYEWLLTKGNTGAAGSSVTIMGSLTSEEDLDSITDAEKGDTYIINGNLWVYTGNSKTQEGKYRSGFENVGSLKGADGVNITSCVEEYTLTEKGAEPTPDSVWTTAIQYAEGKVLWKRYRYSWSDDRADTTSDPQKDEYVNQIGTTVNTYIGEDGIYTGKIAAKDIVGANISAAYGHIDSACIPDLSAEKITTGTLSANVGITAVQGSIGDWDIDEEKIYKESGNGNIWLYSDPTKGIQLQRAEGLQNFVLNVNEMSFTDGLGTSAVEKMKIDFSDGSGFVAGGNITWDEKGAGSIAGGKISWTSDGSATFAGKITGAEGEIGGWSIAQTALKKDGTVSGEGYINLDAENTALKFGTMASATAEGDATMVIDGTALSFGTPKEGVYPNYLNGTGDGSLANGNLTWDKDGALTLTDGEKFKVNINADYGLAIRNSGDTDWTKSVQIKPGAIGVVNGDTYTFAYITDGTLTLQDTSEGDTTKISLSGVKFYHSKLSKDVQLTWEQIYDLVNGISES